MMLPYKGENDRTDMAGSMKEESNVDDIEEFNQLFKTSCFKRFLIHRTSKVFLLFTVLSAVTPPLIYYFLFSSILDYLPTDGYSVGSCLTSSDQRIPCGYENVTQESCNSQCCYDLENLRCFHKKPSRFSYITDRMFQEDISINPRISLEPYSSKASLTRLNIAFDEFSHTHLQIMVYNPAIMSHSSNKIDWKEYSYEVTSPEIDVTVTAHGIEIFKTDHGPLIAAENLWEWSFYLTADQMFGLGEIPLNGRIKKVLYSNENQEYFVPLIFARKNGIFYGIYFDIDEASEIEVLHSNHIIVRSIALYGMKFQLFTGPTPKDIMNDLLKWKGNERNHFEFWELGVHVCSEVTSSMAHSYTNLDSFLSETSKQGIPFDSHCGVSSIELNSETLNNNKQILENGIAAISEAGKRLVIHLAPYITINITSSNIHQEYNETFIMNGTTPYIGLMNNKNITYPDYENNITSSMVLKLWPFDNMWPDGFALINNWPIDEKVKLFDDIYTSLTYFSEALEQASFKTLPWNVTHSNKMLHIYRHNLYGHHQVKTISILKNNESRSPIITSNPWTHTNAGYNRQNLNASWTNFRRELIHISLAGISGTYKWMTPICGDTKHFDRDLQLNLCTKWYMASTFIPFVKIHSIGIERDPLQFNSMEKVYIAEALERRYSLLSYFYTSLDDGPVLRPMFYQFPDETSIHDLTNQFCVGDSLLVVPNFIPDQALVNIYLPSGTWFEFWGGIRIYLNASSSYTSLPTTLSDLVVLIQGGHIVLIQQDVRESAEETHRQSPYTIIIALACQSTNVCTAAGQLKINDYLKIELSANSTTLTLVSSGSDWDSLCLGEQILSSHVVSTMKIYGLDSSHNNFDNFREVHKNIDFCELKNGVMNFDLVIN